MTRPGGSPGAPRRRAALGAWAAGLALVVAAGGLASSVWGLGTPAGASGAASSSGSTTTTTNPWVPGANGTMTVGIDAAPTGCNPNTASGDTWADRLVLEPVLPSAFYVNANGQPTYDPALITQAELQSTNPETVVYTINPKAVWSDGKPITAADLIYTWQQERGTQGTVGSATGTSPTPTSATTTPAAPPTTTPAVSPSAPTTLPGATGTTGPAVGYRQIASMKPSNHGRTVTVVFKTPYADWQSLFNFLLPAQVLAKTGWDPHCTDVTPSIDLSAGPFVLAKVQPTEIVLARNPRWWEQAPALARIVIKIARSPAELATWLARGTIDVALPTGFNEQYVEAVSSQPGVLSQSDLTSTFLQLDLSTTAPLVSEVDVRLAIAHAIDRQSLVNDVVGWSDSTVVPAASHIYAQSQSGYPAHKPPPLQVRGQPGYTSTTAAHKAATSTPFPTTAQPAETAKLLDSLGFVRTGNAPWTAPTGKPLSLHMAVDTADPWAAKTASELVHQLGAAGIQVSIVDTPGAQATGEALSTGSAEMALIQMHSSPFPSQAIAWYTPLLGAPGTGGSQDWTNLNDPTLNTLLEKASQELNPVDAAPIYAQADTALWQQMVALPLFDEPGVLAWSGLTSGVSPNFNGPSLLWSPQSWALRVPPTSPDTQAG